ncbi:MAG TPA: hypothetical protein PK926_15805 [Spirochaetota bacterium]|nr:hypothetical protein [Spirochaetota bacterium]HPI90947.1 hypothetical protein [Spirochaetota bacterium]HPR47307.1 hypothetical protein [Spirochaetota bacterium]
MALPCENCKMRAVYDKKPASLIGRFWKFHIKFCPGWKMYLKSLPEDRRQEMFRKYGPRKL